MTGDVYFYTFYFLSCDIFSFITSYCYISSESEDEEVRDEQGRILHSDLSKEELAAMQEALAEDCIIKLDTKQILDLKEVGREILVMK